jgi:hypothetical protein
MDATVLSVYCHHFLSRGRARNATGKRLEGQRQCAFVLHSLHIPSGGPVLRLVSMPRHLGVLLSSDGRGRRLAGSDSRFNGLHLEPGGSAVHLHYPT